MILCCGESLIDMLPRQTASGETAFAPVAGGAVFNTAIALGRLGAPAGYFGGISTDLFGQILDGALSTSRVDASLARRSARPTTLASSSMMSYSRYTNSPPNPGPRFSHYHNSPLSTITYRCAFLISGPCQTLQSS